MSENKCPCKKEKQCEQCGCEQCEPIDEALLFEEYPILKLLMEQYESNDH